MPPRLAAHAEPRVVREIDEQRDATRLRRHLAGEARRDVLVTSQWSHRDRRRRAPDRPRRDDEARRTGAGEVVGHPRDLRRRPHRIDDRDVLAQRHQQHLVKSRQHLAVGGHVEHGVVTKRVLVGDAARAEDRRQRVQREDPVVVREVAADRSIERPRVHVLRPHDDLGPLELRLRRRLTQARQLGLLGLGAVPQQRDIRLHESDADDAGRLRVEPLHAHAPEARAQRRDRRCEHEPSPPRRPPPQQPLDDEHVTEHHEHLDERDAPELGRLDPHRLGREPEQDREREHRRPRPPHAGEANRHPRRRATPGQRRPDPERHRRPCTEHHEHRHRDPQWQLGEGLHHPDHPREPDRPHHDARDESEPHARRPRVRPAPQREQQRHEGDEAQPRRRAGRQRQPEQPSGGSGRQPPTRAVCSRDHARR